MRAITFDIESVSDSMVRGHVDVNEQELVVVAIHDSDMGEYSSYFKEDLHTLWPILERADMLIGFNSDAFDIPLLNRYYPGDLSQHTLPGSAERGAESPRPAYPAPIAR